MNVFYDIENYELPEFGEWLDITNKGKSNSNGRFLIAMVGQKYPSVSTGGNSTQVKIEVARESGYGDHWLRVSASRMDGDVYHEHKVYLKSLTNQSVEDVEFDVNFSDTRNLMQAVAACYESLNKSIYERK